MPLFSPSIKAARRFSNSTRRAWRINSFTSSLLLLYSPSSSTFCFSHWLLGSVNEMLCLDMGGAYLQLLWCLFAPKSLVVKVENSQGYWHYGRDAGVLWGTVRVTNHAWMAAVWSMPRTKIGLAAQLCTLWMICLQMMGDILLL